MRKNPKPPSRDGYLVNPETNDLLWFHGSSSDEPLSLDSEYEDSEHMAFFLSSNEHYAEKYAEQDWSGEDSDHQSLYALRVKECNLLSLDDLVISETELNNEGLKLAREIHKAEPEWGFSAIVQGLLNVAKSMDWQHFIDVEYYDNTLGEELPLYSLPAAIYELGYDGWIERRTTGTQRSHTDLAIFYRALGNVEIDHVVYTTLRSNPSREWFETQSLQNDENGYLINPDTNDIYWYHGSKFGELGDGHVLYFSSDIDIARTMACQMFCYSEDDCTTTVYKAKLKTRADEIFDVRYADSSKNAKPLAERLNLEHPYDEYSLDFDNFDEKLGYHAQTDTDIAYAQSLGFKGWLEVEDPFGDPEPCTIGLFTNRGTNYEIVETVLLSEKDCQGFY
jgi:hypothetical protein